MNSVKTRPDGYHSLTPYIIVDGAEAAIAFYCQVFGARLRLRLPAPGGKIGHAELELGDSVLMLADQIPDMGARGPALIGGSPVSLLLYVDDVDAVFADAVAAGARPVHGVENKFYGDRSGQLTDPFGHTWTLATHVEDVSPEEMRRRMQAMFGG